MRQLYRYKRNTSKVKILFLFILTFLFATSSYKVYANSNDPQASGDATKCSGTIVNFGVPKKLLPFGNGRTTTCVTPKTIVMHITQTGYTTADLTYQDFYNNSNGQNVGSHFVIGRTGDTIQMVESLDKTIEYAAAVGGYSDDISIELTAPTVLNGKNDIPAAEYTSALTLVQKLMSQYSIPVGPHDEIWKEPSSANDPSLASGVYGHYQLNPPPARTDPGEGFMKDFRQDLANGKASGQLITLTTVKSNCVITKIGNPLIGPTIPPDCGNSSGTSIVNCPDALPANAAVSDIAGVMLAKYGFKLTGSINIGRAQDVYNTICLLFQSKTYADLIGSKSSPIEIATLGPDDAAGCGGQQMSNTLVNIYSWCGNLTYANRIILTHELGHVLAHKNPSTYNAFVSSIYGNPSNPQTIPVHNCLWDYDRFGQRGPYAGECFADMIGEYLVYKNWRVVFQENPNPLGPSDPYNPNGPLDRSFPEYPTETHYSAYYNFAKTTIFGGVEYK